MFTVYHHLAIDDAHDSPTADDLRAIERMLDRPLPQAFKDYLAVANGGSLDYVIDLVIQGHREPLSFATLYSTIPHPQRAGRDTFLVEIAHERTRRKVPTTLLPFARDGGDSVVYLDLTVAGTAPVVAWIDGMPGWTGLAPTDGWIRVAESFTAYVNQLSVDAEAVGALLQTAIQTQNVGQFQALREYLAIGLPHWQTIFQIDDNALAFAS